MRRPRREESLHGTRDGHVTVDRDLASRYDLTQREGLCAALIKTGLPLGAVAKRLEISVSTAGKHLMGLRRKLGVQTTQEAVVLLLRHEAGLVEPLTEGFGDAAIETGSPSALEADRAKQLRSAATLREILEQMVDALKGEGVCSLIYLGLPLGVASFRRMDFIRCHAGSERLAAAYYEDPGWVLERVAKPLFASPDGVVIVDSEAEEGDSRFPESLANACRSEGTRYCVSLGTAYGAGYFGVTAFYHGRASNAFDRALEARVLRLRFELRLAQNAAFSFGALAREVGLTIRERDALSLLGEGQKATQAAAGMGISERAFGQLVRSARLKLNANTTAEAVAKAMALNALVFL